MQFSFIIPVYNTQDYIRECIDSIMAQNFQDFEILLMDDGSTDRSGDICDSYCENYPNIHVLHNRNEGPGNARNRGIELARGDYLIFLDSDDYWLPDVLEGLAKTAEGSEITVFGYREADESQSHKHQDFSPVYKNEEGFISGETYLEKVFAVWEGYNWYPWYYAVSRAFINKMKFRFPEKIFYEDLFCMYRLLLSCSKLNCYDETVVYYRKYRNGSTSGSIKLSAELDKLYVVEHNIRDTIAALKNDNLKQKLCNSFACIALSSLILCNLLENRQERVLLLDRISHMNWIFGYVTSGRQRIVLWGIRLMGINITSRLLGWRYQLQKWGKQKSV